ncbi:alpha-(1-_6)-mannopyranosyltransferase A [Corynebacterium aquatimens]|nr:alpha-(1->6)-mannopyranosyltransferase A [Corynebacterium aquatimens]
MGMRRLVTQPLWMGTLAGILMAVGSIGAGATRNRGGFLASVDLSFLSYSHARGIFSTVLAVGVFLLVAAWVLLGRSLIASHRDTGGDLTFVRNCTWAWVAPLLLAAPLMSRDVYSYLMQGAMIRDGFDPYSEGAAVNPGPYLLEVSHDWRNTTTPYGPLHLWIGEAVTTLVGDNVAAGLIVYKFITLAGFAAMVWAIPRIATRLGGDPAVALWLGVANPVMIIHIVGGMHNESVMVGLVSIGLLLSLDSRFFSGVALMAVAVALKATAAIALPFVAWLALRRYADGASLGRRLITLAAAGIAIIAESIAVVAAITWVSGASWGWLAQISGNSKVVNPLSGATFLADAITPYILLFDDTFKYNSALSVSRTIGSVLMLVGLVAVWLVFRQSPRRAVMGTALAYQVAFLFNAVTLPWYFASSISLVGTFKPQPWLIRFTVAASVFVGLAFTGSGNHRFYNGWWVFASLAVAMASAYIVHPRTKSVSADRGSKTQAPARA